MTNCSSISSVLADGPNTSQAGGLGWLTAIRNPDVKGIVALEPGSGFVFPDDALPDPMPSAACTLTPEPIPTAEFDKLTRIPIIIYYGDNIPFQPMAERGKDNRRVRLAMARLWVDAVNARGGDARLSTWTVPEMPAVVGLSVERPL